jgi:hypothetical protein
VICGTLRNNLSYFQLVNGKKKIFLKSFPWVLNRLKRGPLLLILYYRDLWDTSKRHYRALWVTTTVPPCTLSITSNRKTLITRSFYKIKLKLSQYLINHYRDLRDTFKAYRDLWVTTTVPCGSKLPCPVGDNYRTLWVTLPCFVGQTGSLTSLNLKKTQMLTLITLNNS